MPAYLLCTFPPTQRRPTRPRFGLESTCPTFTRLEAGCRDTLYECLFPAHIPLTYLRSMRYARQARSLLYFVFFCCEPAHLRGGSECDFGEETDIGMVQLSPDDAYLSCEFANRMGTRARVVNSTDWIMQITMSDVRLPRPFPRVLQSY